MLPKAHKEGVSRFYRPELDALRFVAFLCVFLHHCLLLLAPARYQGAKYWAALAEETVHESMAYGVCLFFFLSSYLITTLLQRERRKTGTVHLRSFYLRRILRIWPLYFAYIGGNLVVAVFVPAMRAPRMQVLALLFLLGNWFTAHAGWAGAGGFAVLWSISVEEQFYLVFPTLQRLGGRRVLLGACPAVIAVSCATVYWLSAHGVDWYYRIWTNSFSQFQFFAWGAVTALLLDGRVIRLSSPRRWALFLGGLALWFVSRARPSVPSSAGAVTFGYLLVAAGCICLFLSVYGVEGERVPGWLRYLGKISYGLYIFHGLAVHMLQHWFNVISQGWPGPIRLLMIPLEMVFGLALTIGIAALSYRLLEAPFLRIKDRFEFIRTRAV